MTDLAVLHQQGRLSQRCPACGLVEAAGHRCSKCLARTRPATWLTDSRKVTRGADSGSQRAASRTSGTTPQRPADGTLFGMTSPLRASPAESSDPRPQLPLGGGPVEDSAGVREHTTRSRTAGA